MSGEWGFAILLLALLLDWVLGEPEALWSRFPHPVIVFGKAVSFFDRHLNEDMDTASIQMRKGTLAIILLIAGAFAAGWGLKWMLGLLGWFGYLPELFIVFVLLAQKSLYDHVDAVGCGLRGNGLSQGRRAVGLIVGRDPHTLDHDGVVRASVESLAENFSDGVVAPAFWYAVLGLPGIVTYKMINTADSVIGYKNHKYIRFGRSAAKVDDVVNWIPARLSAVLVAGAAGIVNGWKMARKSAVCAMRDSSLHRSPNAGWPEAAMAGAINVMLGGTRDYGSERVTQASLNASGRKQLFVRDIDKALVIFSAACKLLWALVCVALVLVFI